MKPVVDTARAYAGTVDADDNLERLIALSGGDTNCCYKVQRNGQDVGTLEMKDLVRALVPAQSDRTTVR